MAGWWGLLAAPNFAPAAGFRVWTITETRRVLRSDPPETNASASLQAARNEWGDFQILFRSEEPVQRVGLEPGPLRGPDGFALSEAHLRLYREHQLYLTNGTYRNDSFQPDWYPDPLIPFRDPMTGRPLQGPRFQAVPFDLPAGQTHGFWVDVHVPTNAPPGDYRGVFRLTAGGRRAADVPVALKVWNFTLPETPTLVTAFGSPRLREYYSRRTKEASEPEPADWDAIERQCAQLLSEHHLNAEPPARALTPVAVAGGSFAIPSGQVRALREFVDRYHINALRTPHPDSVVRDPDQQRETLRAWLRAFDEAARELDRPGLVFYTYLKDEPNTLEDYRYVQKWGRAVRECRSVVKVLVVEQPWTELGFQGADSAWGDLYGAVDIWCPLFSLHRQASAAARQTLGETIWTYTALCQGQPTPWWHIDFPLLNYRVPAWMAWRDGMKGLLYWGGMSYWRQSADPWTQAPFYSERGEASQPGRKPVIFNGEGSLVYPAHPVGYDGVAPTIRLKALRDSIQDFEYLAILQRLGRSAEAEKAVRALTPTFFQWNKAPRAYQDARALLAEQIVTSQKNAAPPSR